MLDTTHGISLAEITVTVFLALIAYLKFWPDFKKQKRIDNLCLNAKEALFHLADLENLMNKLKIIHNETLEKSYQDNTQDHLKIQNEISMKLNVLKMSLLLLSKDENLIENEQILRLNDYIKNLEKILNSNLNVPKSYLSIDLLSQLGLLEDDSSFALRGLRDLLLAICQIEK